MLRVRAPLPYALCYGFSPLPRLPDKPDTTAVAVWASASLLVSGETMQKIKHELAISWPGLLTAAPERSVRVLDVQNLVKLNYSFYSGDIYSVKSGGVYYLENSCYCFTNRL